jgi:glycosyltransferase involved in cell wall biosynthesis
MKTLLVFPAKYHRLRYTEQKQLEAAGKRPHESLLEEILNADVIDNQYLCDFQSRSKFAWFIARILPPPFLQALLAYRKRLHYDAVVSWDDRFALTYAFFLWVTRLLRATGSRSRHVAILSWMAPPKKALMLKLVQKGIDRIILWSQIQCDLLVEFFGISPARIVVIPYYVDHDFFRPADGVADYIFSAGDSRRDYGTLIEAVRGLNIRCNIATRVMNENTEGIDSDATRQSLAEVSSFPDNVVCRAESPIGMRAMYAHSRFVVVPLLPSFRDTGISVITQAMAMGKAFICSHIQGQTEFVREGITGLFVPPCDAQALREAIEYLWDHPELAEEMGRHGRAMAEKVFAFTRFVANVRQVVDDVITGSYTAIPTIAEQMRAVSEPTP